MNLLHVDHQLDDVVALGPQGRLLVRDLLADSAFLADQLPPEPGEQIALICADRYAFAASLLAIWRRGHLAVLPVNGQPGTIAELETLTLLHDRDGAAGLDVRPLLGQRGQPMPLPPIPPEQKLVLVQTSGTTGQPTLHPKTALQLLGEVACHAQMNWLQPGDAVLATVPPHHLYGLLFSVLLPLQTRAHFHRETPLHAETLALLAARNPRTLLVAAPLHLRLLDLLDSLPTVTRVLYSTAPLPNLLAQKLHQQGLKVTEILGSTETGGVATRTFPQTTWQPLPGVQVTVAEADQEGAGAMQVQSPFLLQPLRTSDQIRLENQGFSHLGRMDDLVKIGGTRVHLADMEARLRGLPGVRDAVVRALATDGLRGQTLAAVVATTTWTSAQLLEKLAESFAPTTLPRRLVVVAELPRDAQGKLSQEQFRTLLSPEIRLQPTADPLQFVIQVPHHLAVFEGHFPGDPVLPGVAELGLLVLPAQRLVRPEWPTFRRLVRLKFHKLIRPGDTLTLQLQINDELKRLEFRLDRQDGPCASGRFYFAQEA